MDKLMALEVGCDIGNITIGSFQSWVFFVLDISSDVGYYVAIPKRSRLLWILMLITLIAPHVANVFNITRIFYNIIYNK